MLVGRRQDRWSAKYELLHTVRTHMGASDANFGCVVQREDANGKVGQHTGTATCLGHSASRRIGATAASAHNHPAQTPCSCRSYCFPLL